MQIYGPYRVSTTSATGEVQQASSAQRAAAPETASTNTPVDQLDLSQAAAEAGSVNSSGPVAGEGIRFERVAEIRRQIAEGAYDTPERMDAALDRFLDLLG